MPNFARHVVFAVFRSSVFFSFLGGTAFLIEWCPIGLCDFCGDHLLGSGLIKHASGAEGPLGDDGLPCLFKNLSGRLVHLANLSITVVSMVSLKVTGQRQQRTTKADTEALRLACMSACANAS